MVDIKELLVIALEELLQTKSIDDISVSEITKHANLGRTTFYKHFVDKYDLLDWLYLRKFTTMMTQKWEESHSYSMQALAFLEYVDENKESMRNIFKSSDPNSTRSLSSRYVMNGLIYALEYAGADLSDPELRVLCEVYARGVASLVSDWILGKVELPRSMFPVIQKRAMPAEIAQYVDREEG